MARRSLREARALEERLVVHLKPAAEAIISGAANDNRPVPAFASAFEWTEPSAIRKREWLYGRHLIRKFVSVKVAPGGVGKTSLTVAEALAMASGKMVLGEAPKAPLRVCLWNGEDPREELQRRIVGAMLRHGIEPEDLGGRLFLGSGRDRELRIVREAQRSVTVSAPDVASVTSFIRQNRIDALIVDPFVSTHSVSENDNGAIDRVAKQWAEIADKTNCAIELVHHSRKTNGGGDVAAEDARGAVALIAAARSVQTLNRMSKDEAGKLGLREDERARLFRVDSGKANLAPSGGDGRWYRLDSVSLGNGSGPLDPGDDVGVVTSWRYPSAADLAADVTPEQMACIRTRLAAGEYREDAQSPAWGGLRVAEVLGLDPADAGDVKRIKTLIAGWVRSGDLVCEDRLDAKRKPRRFLTAPPS